MKILIKQTKWNWVVLYPGLACAYGKTEEEAIANLRLDFIRWGYTEKEI
jgi:predicted RNase H-like HicB family nuclease